MSFSEIASRLGLSATWESDITTWGKRVKLYRDYAEGNHRGNLSSRMKEMLRISGGDDTEFNINYCNMVVQTIADRLVIGSVQSEKASDWVGAMLAWNSIESLQMDVHEAVIRDGDTFVMVGYDDVDNMPKLSHELAWDGEVGVVPIYDPSNTLIIAALKVWWAVYDTIDENNKRVVMPRQRCNLYLPDMVYKYWFDTWELIEESEWAVGYVPLVHFRHNGRANLARGISEIAPILGLQDSLNRTLVSMTMTSELSAFGIRVAIGFPAPTGVTPGMWIEVLERDADGNPIGLSNDKNVDVKELNATPLVQYIEQADFIIGQISAITRTPLARMGSDASSGESLKQREIGLVAKVKKAQVRLGEAWMWAVELAGMVSQAYGRANVAPDLGTIVVRWANAEVRNDNDVVANARQVRDDVSKREYLRLLAPVFGWDDEAIDKIVADKRGETLDVLGAINGFGGNGRVNPV